ncbi:MAG: VOC family protein [Hydrotalea flava]|uniref:VOC family protein n=1 Tax=Hydrotalea TaxID=1004300 RepID=UPI000945AEB1|nr:MULTISPECIES: VOC family protein [Hydrotalea]MBY0347345.1 VOC family protein [Hydrotalea flava]MDE3124895.1 VOC family protein [Bacteroidota bacterium]NIM35398.1 VOC family protein [Hydrotalea flava]NIM38257.1 VOC family protein [Hydrotalea flava]NIN03421.1 VOC family protein [Hydrotalea flava]
MKQEIVQMALLVRDYDEAIAFYTQKLQFTLIEDTVLTESKRWVVIAPPGSKGCRLLLAKAANEQQENMIGNQTGGRVFLFLHTDNLQRDYENLQQHKIRIIREPEAQPYGTVLVFEDLYGNKWDLIEPALKN